jgi:hypothetical protein
VFVVLTFLVLTSLLCQTPAFAENSPFPLTPVEHVGSEKSDIVHCLLEGATRQFCNVGWGAFKKLEVVRIFAPASYGSELLIPKATETRFGVITSERVIERLQGNLWKTWRITPELNFVLDWSKNPVCWKGGVLQRNITVVAGKIEIGFVEPGLKNYQFPLTTPLGESVWKAVSTSDPSQDRVKWGGQEIDRAVFTEFDLTDGSSNFWVPKSCQIIISNVQTVLNREGSDKALNTMESKVVDLIELMTAESLHYASKVQGSEGVKCVIATQLDSLRQAEHLDKSASSAQLSERSRESLTGALNLFPQLTQYDGSDAMAFLDAHQSDWQRACVGQENQGLAQPQSSPNDLDPEIEFLVSRFREQTATLRDLLEDAWSLAVLLKLVNEDNRRLQWMIDSTIKYHLTTTKDAP